MKKLMMLVLAMLVAFGAVYAVAQEGARQELDVPVETVQESAPEMEEFAVSSTEIRERIRAGLDVNNLVPEKVGIYIREHGLYAR